MKRPSDDATKFDLFQRLNAGGTVANPQELRNSIALMVNAPYFRELRTAAENSAFRKVTGVTEDQEQRQRHLELAMRFLVHTFIEYDGRLDVEEYIDEGAIALARNGDVARDTNAITQTFALLLQADGDKSLRRFDGSKHVGKIGLVALETIAVGVSKNLSAITKLPDPVGFVRQKSREFWQDSATASFTSPGVRGTTRIQRTVPFGATWFNP